MALAALWVLPVAFAIVGFSAKIQENLNQKAMDVKMACADGIQECIETVRDLKANNAEQAYLKGLEKKIRAVEHRSILNEFGLAVFVVSASLVLKLGIATVALVGAVLLMQGSLSVLTFFMFLLVVSRLYDPLQGALQNLAAVILARSSDDFPAIRQEADRLRAIFMAGHPNFDLLYRGQPDTYFVAAQRYSANNPPAVKEAVRQYILTLLVLLIVPAVNLSGLTLSRMRKRISEIGVRKAFGAPRRELMMQVLSENMLYSLFGGILGLVLSYVAAFLLGGMLFSVDFVSNGVEDLRTMCVDLLFDPTVFLLAFLACFLLNLLSAVIPAWRVTRTNIVDAINER